MITEIPGYVIICATAVGTAFAAYATKRTKAELDGPGDEPSLRKLLKDNSQAVANLGEKITKDFASIHIEVAGLSGRIESLETAVFNNLERRVDKIEDRLNPRPRRKVKRPK